MTMRPDLDYVDEGVDLQDPALYKPSRGRFGTARILTPIAYRSKVFADLEDEKIWTRSWVCIGSQRDIPNVGDLLPYTVGNHGVHVQRGDDGLTGRYNLAQHGGCRFVPAQCQTGSKTRCSFTSCGYSRDRGVIAADELGDNTPTMRQYLGYRPERLLPVTVESEGPLLFVNLDPEAAPLAERLDGVAEALDLDAAAAWENAESFWVEYGANWKLLGRALLSSLAPEAKAAKKAGGDAIVLNARADYSGAPATVFWLLPNLILLRGKTSGEHRAAALPRWRRHWLGSGSASHGRSRPRMSRGCVRRSTRPAARRRLSRRSWRGSGRLPGRRRASTRSRSKRTARPTCSRPT